MPPILAPLLIAGIIAAAGYHYSAAISNKFNQLRHKAAGEKVAIVSPTPVATATPFNLTAPTNSSPVPTAAPANVPSSTATPVSIASLKPSPTPKTVATPTPTPIPSLPNTSGNNSSTTSSGSSSTGVSQPNNGNLPKAGPEEDILLSGLLTLGIAQGLNFRKQKNKLRKAWKNIDIA